MSQSTLLRGVTILGAAAIISKLLGTLQKIPMQNIGGDEAFGIYSAVFPIYTLIIFLATAGFPVAISKFVSESLEKNNEAEAFQILKVSCIILFLSGLLFFSLLFFGAHIIANAIDNEHTIMAIQSISFALLFAPIMSALRGYFQGKHNMIPTAISQVIEQFVRVFIMIILLLYLTYNGYSNEWIAAGGTFGSTAGALAGFIVMFFIWMKEKNHIQIASTELTIGSMLKLSKKLIHYALPVCLGSIVVPILGIVDSFTLPRLIGIYQGLNESHAIEQFGIYARGLTLIQLVAMIFTSVSVALVPLMAELKLKGHKDKIKVQTELSIRFTWLIGIAASFGLFFCIKPILIMLFENELGVLSASILSFAIVFSVLNIVSTSILQGLGFPFIPAVNLLIATGLKVILNVWFVSLWGIEGAALSTVFAFVAASILNLITLYRKTAFSIKFSNYFIKPIFSIVIMGISIYIIYFGLQFIFDHIAQGLEYRLSATIISLFAVSFGAMTYLISIFVSRTISEDDLSHMPSLSNKISPLLTKIKMRK
ncbi:putative polysaccharide biosynthesis protein [Chengkuizengella axinellae]|uniref:Polysaccharide biosynthesis protein n=1 Tax=Chengkuizengella axinellae TaxID=3064388 RepID=A0ABT9J5Q8_9BACL|nr:polysaccharide biosynthesis protein [Chengkuizengella sp. 2205SS18-9]MDP5276951.1 polysaccharide biosynthesis protein [Chengkuizengella sp. 2205SS18-9]